MLHFVIIHIKILRFYELGFVKGKRKRLHMGIEPKQKAIVLGSKGVNAMGLIRSLGLSGVHVVFASPYSKIESKYATEYVHLPNCRENWNDILISYAHTNRSPIAIFPTDDETAFWLDENYKELQKSFVISHANGELRRLADKTVMSTIAQKSGLNVPKFEKISLENAERKNQYPIILKPFAGYAGSKGDIVICHNDNEYVKAVRILIKQGYKEILLQQLLNDPEQEEIGLMGMALPNGRVVIPGVIHKIRSYPTGKGSTSYARFSPDMDGIDVDKIKKFVSFTNYIGLFDIEMIKAYEKYWFIEINYRNGQYGYTPTAAGYNLPVNWLAGMCGKQIVKCNHMQDIYYMNEREDYCHVKEGEISRKEWMEQFHAVTAYGMYCPGDQRPFIRQYVKIPDRMTIKCKKWYSHIKDLFIKEEWNIAIRKKDENSLWKRDGDTRNFNVLPNTIRYWAADPFVISKDKKDYLFFEMFDRFKGKGLIGYREISDNNVGKMKVVYEAVHHLSFPYIFKYDNEYYMMPEYSEGKELPLLRATHFPDRWEKVESWMMGKRVVDSVLLRYENQIYLFTQELEEGYLSDELSIFVQEGKAWSRHAMNPVVKSLTNSRLAGKIFQADNKLIRVAQDCKNGYGIKLHFSNIIELSGQKFSEEIFKTISIEDIKTNSKEKFCGLHTYNFNDKYEVIDLKNMNKIKFGNVVNIVWRIICRLRKRV